MDGKDVQMVSYPGSQKRNGKYRPIYTNGKLKYNPATGNFNSDVFGDGGSSGAGYITEIDGYPVIISNNSAKTIASSQRVAPVIEWKDIAKMRTRLSQQKVDGADHIFN